MEYGYLEQYYNGYDENGRLLTNHGRVEYLTTMRYIQRYVKPGSRILEVGAGTGRYSIALSRAGHRVTAVELIQHNIDVFKSQLTPQDDIELLQGNAMELSALADDTFDAVLLLGPLYHLYTEEDQLAALREARRVLKADGTLFAAYCLNEATMIQFCFRGDGQNMLDCLEKHMLTDDYRCISTPADLFQMMRVEEIDRLNALCGLKRVQMVGIDTFANYMRDRINSWSETVFQAFLQYHFSICERPDIIGVSNHALDILKK